MADYAPLIRPTAAFAGYSTIPGDSAFYYGLPELGRNLVASVAPVATDRRAMALPKLEKTRR